MLNSSVFLILAYSSVTCIQQRNSSARWNQGVSNHWVAVQGKAGLVTSAFASREMDTLTRSRWKWRSTMLTLD